ncbi:MAG: hypothetical protein CMJ83_08615 [Planctomycetes bacterium]|nr:hypothetical protein [Planctomycetota bacterium]
MTGGAELATELRKGKRGGIPWIAILDGAGKPRITSDGPKGNCGCPAQPHEIDHFMAMVDATRQHMSSNDRKVIERELRTYGAYLTRPRKSPGVAAYRQAVSNVKHGRFNAAVKEIGAAFSDGYAPETILTDPSLRPLREDPDRRTELFKLVREHVSTHRIRLVDRQERGRRIRLRGQVVDMDTSKPLPGALVQLFHTDASGEYRPGMDAGGGAGNPRLWGYLRTNAEGRFELDTIMPERYPNSSIPRHVHYHVWADGHPELASECFFDSDPNLDDRTRKSAPERNFPIVTLKRDDDGRMAGSLTVRVPAKKK